MIIHLTKSDPSPKNGPLFSLITWMERKYESRFRSFSTEREGEKKKLPWQGQKKLLSPSIVLANFSDQLRSKVSKFVVCGVTTKEKMNHHW